MKVKWPCAFPKRWKMFPSKRLFPESKERAPESDKQLSATQDYGVIAQAEFMRLAGRRVVQLNQHLDKRKRVEVGDFVISMRSFQGGLERAWTDGGIRSSYVVLKPRKDLVLGYYQRLFKSEHYIQALQSTANFIRDGQDLNYQNFVLIDLPYPPISEQRTIADFLDHETARINALIAEQERLIELLKEKRQAVISHAVTKGLDPTVPMKDSGVEWLGEVPKHWGIKRLKHISPRISGRLVFKPAQYFADEGIPFLMGNNVTEFGIRWEGCKLIPEETNNQFAHYALKEGDVITVRVGDPGVTCVVPPEAEGLNCGSLMIIRRSASFNSFWLAHVMNSPLIRLQIDKVQYGAAQEQINITDAVNFLIPVPPLEEQKAIVTFLRNKISQFNELIFEAETGIQLLQERRSTLISAAVTGKIDVRDWKAPATASPTVPCPQ